MLKPLLIYFGKLSLICCFAFCVADRIQSQSVTHSLPPPTRFNLSFERSACVSKTTGKKEREKESVILFRVSFHVRTIIFPASLFFSCRMNPFTSLASFLSSLSFAVLFTVCVSVEIFFSGNIFHNQKVFLVFLSRNTFFLSFFWLLSHHYYHHDHQNLSTLGTSSIHKREDETKERQEEGKLLSHASCLMPASK